MTDTRKLQKKKKMTFAALAVALLAALLVCAGFSLRARGEADPSVSVAEFNEDRSKILLRGKNYYLNDRQEKDYLEEMDRWKERREQEEAKDEEETADSIVTPEITDAAEKLSDEVVAKVDGSERQKSDDIQTGGQEDTGNAGDGGSGAGGGNDDGGSGDGDRGNGNIRDRTRPMPTPTPTPTATPSPTPEPVPDKKPTITYNDSLYNGTSYPGQLTFQVCGWDYKGNPIEAFNYEVYVDGIQVWSRGQEGAFARYREDVSEGWHEVTVAVNYQDNDDKKIYTTTEVFSVEILPPELQDEYANLTVDISSIGRGVVLSTSAQIYPGESVSHFVDRVLRNNGFTPQRGPGTSYYLARIHRAGIVGDPGTLVIPAEYQDSAYPEYADPDSLGEKDIVATSGWLYSLNGAYMGVGMDGVTLYDGDNVYLWFSLGG